MPCNYRIVLIKLANWEIERLKVDCAFSSLLIHARFDDIMGLRGWNRFRGLCVDWKLCYLCKLLEIMILQNLHEFGL